MRTVKGNRVCLGGFPENTSRLISVPGKKCCDWLREKSILGGLFIVLMSAMSSIALCGSGSNPEKASPGESGGNKPPNVIFILVDALGYDAIHAFGNPNETTPNIDTLLKETVVFERAFSQATITWTSVSSIFTGLYPGQHKVKNFDSKLPGEIITLPEIFRKHGYKTAVFSANINISPVFGFNQGIDYFYYEGGNTAFSRSMLKRGLSFIREQNPLLKNIFPSGEKPGYTDAATLLGASSRWMKKNRDKPFFAYIHLMEPHIPYNAPDSYRLMFVPPGQRKLSLEDLSDSLSPMKNEKNITPDDPRLHTLRSIYDGQVRYMDSRLNEFIERMKKMGLYENSIIVFCADHGEEFGEHGTVTHGNNVYNTLMHVPLFIRFPGGRFSGRIDTPVALFSSLLTAADYAGLPIPGDRPAESLLPLIKNRKAGYSTPIYAQAYTRNRTIDALVHWPWKIVKYTDQSNPRRSYMELYNLESDFDETTDVSSSNSGLMKSLSKEIEAVTVLKYDAGPAEAKIDERTRQKLKSLGYVK